MAEMATQEMDRATMVGVWLIGARGTVATTTVTGALAIAGGLAGPAGCVSALPEFADAGLAGFESLVFGGHDIAGTPMAKRAWQCAEAGVIPLALAEALAPALDRADEEIRPAPLGGSQRHRLDVMAADLADFRTRHGLGQVVVVNLASTEPPCSHHPVHADLDALEAALDGPEPVLPDSALYAFAALSSGCAYVNFTPSAGTGLPALEQLADRQRVPYAGCDGKTGETLVKSALAPMFAARNLRVESWSGINLLGGGDGATLSDAGPREVKSASKQRVLTETLGYTPAGPVHIDCVPDLGDHKTAWDLITFTGFLGVRMRMDFTWHGVDSALAAPLVLDLARLTARAHQRGHAGPLTDLAFFFKNPVGQPPHDLASQRARLRVFAAALAGASGPADHAPARI